MTLTVPFGRAEIEAIIPHRDPFLLIDEVVELEPGLRVAARKAPDGRGVVVGGALPRASR